MKFTVIIEKNGAQYRALIPQLANLVAEGPTREDALFQAQRAAEAYLAQVELVQMELKTSVQIEQRFSTAQDWLNSAGKLKLTDEELEEHLAEIYTERRRQREEVEREYDLLAAEETAEAA